MADVIQENKRTFGNGSFLLSDCYDFLRGVPTFFWISCLLNLNIASPRFPVPNICFLRWFGTSWTLSVETQVQTWIDKVRASHLCPNHLAISPQFIKNGKSVEFIMQDSTRSLQGPVCIILGFWALLRCALRMVLGLGPQVVCTVSEGWEVELAPSLSAGGYDWLGSEMDFRHISGTEAVRASKTIDIW
jgi:hypothetical protein